MILICKTLHLESVAGEGATLIRARDDAMAEAWRESQPPPVLVVPAITHQGHAFSLLHAEMAPLIDVLVQLPECRTLVIQGIRRQLLRELLGAFDDAHADFNASIARLREEAGEGTATGA